jgi:hypothetical protein
LLEKKANGIILMSKYYLYGSEGCHLCEQALSMCLAMISKEQLIEIDIIEQEVAHEEQALVELYGIYIPVLEKLEANTNKSTKLFWPFSHEQIQQLINV